MMTVSPPKSHTAKIRPDGRSRFVEPGALLAVDGDNVAFLNQTEGMVTVVIPDGGAFGSAMMVTVEPGKQSESYPLSGHAEPAIFPYTAYCHDTRQFAHASIPIIIIYPRVT